MPDEKLTRDDPLDDFSARLTSIDGIEKTVRTAGEGPAVIVMTEMPGISPHVARFARWVRDAGFTRLHAVAVRTRRRRRRRRTRALRSSSRACVSAEFRALAPAASRARSPRWLRALATLAHEECGGPGVGAIGMCFTGNFALIDDARAGRAGAGALSQPSLPLDDPAGTRDRAATSSRRSAGAWSART